MHLMNGKNGEIIGALYILACCIFFKKSNKEFIKIGLTYLMSFCKHHIEVLMADFDNHLVHVIYLARSREKERTQKRVCSYYILQGKPIQISD